MRLLSVQLKLGHKTSDGDRHHLQGSHPLRLLHSVLCLQLQGALRAADAEGKQAAGVTADITPHLCVQQADLLAGLLVGPLPPVLSSASTSCLKGWTTPV